VNRNKDFPPPNRRFLEANLPQRGLFIAKALQKQANKPDFGQFAKSTGLCAIQFEAAAGRSHHFGENLTVLVMSHHFGDSPKQ
jgi:hypothetical protein